jgi:hypothetical protein
MKHNSPLAATLQLSFTSILGAATIIPHIAEHYSAMQNNQVAHRIVFQLVLHLLASTKRALTSKTDSMHHV